MRILATGLAIIALLILTHASCQTSSTEPRKPAPARGDDDDDDDDSTSRRNFAVTYDGWVEEWVEDNCLSCHKAGGSAEPDLSSYSKLKRHAKTSYGEMKRGDMPPRKKVKQSDLKKFDSWIDDRFPRASSSGFDDDDDDDDSTSRGLAITYDNWVNEWLKDDCTSCHKTSGSATPVLDSYTKAKRYGREMLKEVEGGSMPPGKQASKTVIRKLRDWVENGMPENNSGGTSRGGGNDDDDDDDARSSVTYDLVIRGWIDRHCMPCHDRGATPPNLSSKSSAQSAARSMISSVQRGEMPPSRNLPASEQKILRDWVDSGAP